MGKRSSKGPERSIKRSPKRTPVRSPAKRDSSQPKIYKDVLREYEAAMTKDGLVEVLTLADEGCLSNVPLHISTQSVELDDGAPFTPDRYATIRDEELDRLGGRAQGRLADATDLLDRLVLDDDFAEFLTLRAYGMLD